MTHTLLPALEAVSWPGTHLGLTWEPADQVNPDELQRLAGGVESTSSLALPSDALRTIYIPSASSDVVAHVGLAGRDSSGALVAIGTVRVAEDAGRTVAAIRAMIDPEWCGRGIGRALLAWQDACAIELLGGEDAHDAAIGVPIIASSIERRRLYAAAGFSAATRVEVVSRRLGDSHSAFAREGIRETSEGWQVRALRSDDTAALAPLMAEPRDPFGFMLRAMTASELVQVADQALSSVLERDGRVMGGILVAELETQPRQALVLGLGLRDEAFSMAEGLLADQCERLWAAGIESTTFALTPPIARHWAKPLAALACVSSASNPLYTIELT